MKKVMQVLALMLVLSALGNAQKPLPPFSITLEPVTLPQGSGPAALRLLVVPRFQSQCDVTITVTPLFNLTYIGEKTWVTKAKKDSAVFYTLKVIIPPEDTSGIEVMVDGGSCGRHYASNHFVTTGDTIEVYPGNPRHASGIPSPSRTNDPIRDILTEEQLQTEYEVWLDLRDSTHLEIAEKILGPLPDSSKCEGYDGYYILKIPLEKVLKLAEQGIELDTIRKKKSTRGIDSLQKRQLPTDSAKGEGALPTSSDGFSLEYVDGMTTPGVLPTNQEITFYLRIYNNTPTNMEGMTNGFRIYSPDGAWWDSFSADTLNLGWEDMFDMWYSINHYSADGVGADTAGFTGISWDSLGGLPPFFDEVSYTITVGPIDDSYDGKTICLDSSFYGGTGYWSWAYGGGSYVYYPAWDGPHCFTIEAYDSIAFSGYLYYLDPVPPDTNEMPIRRIRIEMWDDDQWPLADQRLDSTPGGPQLAVGTFVSSR